MNRLQLKGFFVILVMFMIVLISIEKVEAKRVIINKRNKSVNLLVGKTKTIKINKVSKKVKWKIVKGKKRVKIVKKSGKHNSIIKLKAKKTGKAVIKVINNKKIYRINITVKKKKKLNNKKDDLNNKIIPSEKNTTSEETKDEITTPNEEDDLVQYATVTFVTHGHIEVESIKVKIGQPYGELPDLNMKVENYLFLGWLTEYYGGVKIKKDDICFGDITLYAELRYIGETIEED